MRRSTTKGAQLLWKIITLFACCTVGAFLARGLMLPGKMSLADGLPFPSKGFARDGWLHDHGELQISGLSSVGNSLSLGFEANRPGAPAEFEIALCGMPKGRWTIGTGVQRLKLNGECSPQIASFRIINPIQVHESDTRQLGAQIKHIKIESKLGFPIPSASSVILTAAVFLVTVVGVYFATGSMILSVISIVCAALVLRVYESSPFILHSLWMIGSGLLYGFGFGRCVLFDRRRSWRSPYDNSPQLTVYTLAAFFAVVIGAYLRFGGVTFGLPDQFHPDEIPKAQVILRMYESGSFNPKYFLHPSLLLYLSYGASLLIHFFSMDEFYQTIFIAGRLVSAMAGTLSVVFLYLIGRSLYGQSAGAIAALLLAVFPLHVTSSRYMKEDALLLCLVLLCFHLVLLASKSGRSRDLYTAALCAGFCASSKYSGAIAGGFIALAPWIRTRSFAPDPKLCAALPLAIVFVLLGFLLGTPFSVLDHQSFLQGLSFEKKHMLRGHTESISAWSQVWTYHWGRSIVPGITAVSACFATLGIGLLLYRRRFEDLLVIGLFLLFYLPAEWVKAKPAPQPERYIFPCLPFLALIMAESFRILWHHGRRITALILIVLAIFFPLKRSIELYRDLTPDTRTIAAQWIAENIPQQSKIVLDFVPYAPAIDPQRFTIVNNPLLPVGTWLDKAKLRTYEVDYVILSSLSYDRFFSQPGQPPGMRIQLRKVFALPLEKEFKPTSGTYGFHNPTIRIFRVSGPK